MYNGKETEGTVVKFLPQNRQLIVVDDKGRKFGIRTTKTQGVNVVLAVLMSSVHPIRDNKL